MKKKVAKDKRKNLYRNWKELSQPDKVVWFWQTAFYIIYAVIYSLMTIFAAKTINCLYSGDFHGAFFWLAVEMADILVRNIAIHAQYHFYTKHYGIIRSNITTKIYDKIISCESHGVKNLSTEKIINIAQNNMGYAAEFPDYVASILRYIVQTLIAIVTIFVYNVYAGLVVAALGVVNYFVYRYLNKKLGRIMTKRYERKDDSFKEYSKIVSGKDVIDEMGAKENYKKKLAKHINNFNKEYDRYYKTYSFRENIYYVIWNAVIYAITAALIYLVSKGGMELGVYLVIVPYLSTCTDKLNTLYTKFGDFENVRMDVDRVNLILDLTDKQMVQYGNVNVMTEGYNLGFIGVSYKSPENEKVNLKDVDISFKMNAVNVIKGDRGCGKRAIFDMLRRKIKPDKGEILLDNLDLYAYNEKTFKNHIDYCAAHPVFLAGTVKENLLIAKNNFKFIVDLVEELGLTKNIENLPNGYDTRIADIKNGETLFWIGLIRAALSQCNVLMIYEYPDDVTPNFHTTLQHIIATSEPDKRTLIFFTHKNDYDDLADLLYEIKNGKVVLNKANAHKSK